ncbi:MAG: GSCFA domain-containing protein [Asticcacaulis sp.]
MSHPYNGLKDYQFWRRGVSRVETHLFDPVTRVKFHISPKARVATAGSCFAQHISKRLSRIGFNYYVTETGEHLPEAERTARNYGVFSARYGNIYTTAQLHQLFDEALENRRMSDLSFQRPDGRYVDALRQQIQDDGFASPDDVTEDRRRHLSAVREMFAKADVFVFTLGLTEAWRERKAPQGGLESWWRRLTGGAGERPAVFPLAPGVVGGRFDPETYEFVNFGVDEVQGDLFAVLDKIKKINPGIKVLLTVSPVPLMATFEDRNVLVATTYSKAVLRVAAEAALKAYDWVDYFPSYEIITGSFSGGLYYEPDFREVNSLGVAHAMRVFVDNYVREKPKRDHARPSVKDIAASNAIGVVCDEMVLDQAAG